MFKQMESKKSRGIKSNWKKFWSKLRLSRKRAAPKGETRHVEENIPFVSRIHVKSKGSGTAKEVGVYVTDIHEIDKDRIRTTCKEAVENLPQFPTREEVKEKIENAHKYYGVKCVYNRYVDSEDPDGKEDLQPSWYYILERPIVEQYVLMNNYIRKLSVMASLEKEQSGVKEEPAIEEEVSSISSLSDYGDFAPDSKIAAKLKELKKVGELPSQIGASRLEQELMELKKSAKSEERTVRTNEYTIVIREPTRVDGNHETRVILPSSSNSIEREEIKIAGRLEDGGVEDSDPHSSGDHLPDTSDFDLSQNLVDGPVEVKTGFRRPSYYHWQGNSTPTKTPLLNMDCQPPVTPRAPGTARDFLSFRSLSLSPEFVDSCRDYRIAFAEECRSAYLKDLAGPGDSDDDLDEGHISSGTQTEHCKPPLSLTWEDSMKNCYNDLGDPEANSIVERAALVSDYFRECGEQVVHHINGIHIEDTDSADGPPASASNIIEDERSPYEFENDDILRTSFSQMDTTYAFTESESASSMETQIPAKSSNLE